MLSLNRQQRYRPSVGDYSPPADTDYAAALNPGGYIRDWSKGKRPDRDQTVKDFVKKPRIRVGPD